MSTNSESQDKKLQLDIHFLFKEFNKAYRIEVEKKDNWESDLNNELSRIAKKHNNDYINQKDLSCFSFAQSSNLKGKDLTEVDFSNSNLTKADLRGAKLTNVNWTETNLYCTDFRNTNLTSEQLKTINNKLENEQKIKNISVAIFDDNIPQVCQQYINERDNTTSN